MEITATRQPLLTALANLNQDYAGMIQTAVDSMTRLFDANSDANGKLLRRNQATITAQAGTTLQRVFFIRDNDSFIPPTYQALTPFAQMLNLRMAQATYQTLQAHQRFLKAALPDELYRRLAAPTAYRQLTSELGDDERKKFMERWAHLRLFSPNPLAQYEPMHTWVDPNGYTLSGRIWRTGVATRQRLDALITQGINEGWSARRLARSVEQFLRPDRANLRTQRPYGSDGSFDAMRLARTEITRAHGQAVIISSNLNPFVTKIDWRLSGSHRVPDICDDMAAGGPYDIDKVPPYPAHPNDMCPLVSLVTTNRQQVIDDIRQALDEAAPLGIQPSVNPTNPEGLLTGLVGNQIAQLVLNNIANVLF